MNKPKDFLLIGGHEPMATRLKDNSNVFKGIPPYFMPYGRDFIKYAKKAHSFPAYALPILAACLKKKNISVSCVNDFYSEDPEKMREAIRNTRYAAGISTTFLTHGESIIKIAEFIRSANSSLKILMGGPGIINFPEARKRSDINILYEGERTLEELAPLICKGKRIPAIKGISRYRGKAEVFTERRESIEDLSAIPLPHWEVLSDKVKEEKYLPIETSRGCIGRCSFCLERKYWPGVRLYPINRVMRELENNISKFGIRFYYFQDSNMANNRTYLAGLCDAMRKEGLGIRWSCESRIDTLTMELVDKMRASGCRAITFGMESADTGVLKNMNKAMSDKKIKEFAAIVRHMRQQKMLANINIMVGFPGEDKDSIDRTIDFLLESKPISYSMSKFFLERGTDIWNNRKIFGLRGKMYRWKHDTMDDGQLDEALRRVFLGVSSGLDIYHWTSATVDLIVHMSRGKGFDEFVRYLKSINRICVEDLTRKTSKPSAEYDKSFRYITKYLSY